MLRSGSARLPPSELPLVRFGIDATLSQMLEEGVMHADPHGGNLLQSTTFLRTPDVFLKKHFLQVESLYHTKKKVLVQAEK